MSANTLIIQPWFTGYGHPAQTVLNTARVLGKNTNVEYLVSHESGNNPFIALEKRLSQFGQVETFKVPSSSVRIGTLLSLLVLPRLGWGGKFKRILFLDAHLVLLAFAWRWVARFIKSESLSVIYLMGPEKISGNRLVRRIVSRFLSRPDTRLFLRTEELAEAWRNAFPAIAKDKIDVMPSLELTEADSLQDHPSPAERLEFGILGQVRPGKNIEQLVPLFVQNPGIGRLTVAGAFACSQHEKALSVLHAYPSFINQYLAEDELVVLAKKQHYLLMLYDNWDARMEAATLYLAAKVNRPVIVRNAGWCGRMVKTYHCGIVCEKGSETVNFFKTLPKPGEDSYEALLSGVSRFREAHSGPAWRQAFLDKIIGKSCVRISRQ